MSDGIWNTTSGACEDEEVECYHYCNGFCMISPCGGQCPFEGGEKLDCEDYEEV